MALERITAKSLVSIDVVAKKATSLQKKSLVQYFTDDFDELNVLIS